MLVPGYRIGGPFSPHRDDLLRGEREADDRPVLIKATAGGPVDSEPLEPRHEYRLLASLAGVDGVAAVLGVDEPSGALVLEDPGCILLEELLERQPLAVEEFLDVAIAVCATVAELHRRGIVHGNLQPGTILVHPTTRQSVLFDLSLASGRAESARSAGAGAAALGLRVSYAAPERTGRMSCIVDHRSDLYSLGVVFYEMLSGRTPFGSADALETLHAHFAKAAPPLSEVAQGVPLQLSRIVMRLLGKNADDRYQSAWGLGDDLRSCAAQWAARGSIAEFPLGATDVSDHLALPRCLYGRESELEALLGAFERASAGGAQLLEIAGQAGTGKTSLVFEIHQRVVRRGGRFVSGKFDLLERSAPYGALVPAFRSLLMQVLRDSEDRLEQVRGRLDTVLGLHGGFLVSLIPEIELLTGPLPAAPHPRSIDAQNLLSYVFGSMVEVFATAEHPLVVFLDDLQWADAATLSLLTQLLTTPTVGYVLVIGAFRDDEVASTHPLRVTLERLEAAGTAIEEIRLSPLAFSELRQLIADVLSVSDDPVSVDGLTELVLAKTAGNPFFVGQFLKTLHADGLLSFDHGARRWVYDLPRIRQAEITDNVVDLLAKKLHRFDADTRETIALAACIGSMFRLETLAIVRQRPASAVARELWEAVREGLVVPADAPAAVEHGQEGPTESSDAFRFLHDRVQQAAYSLIPLHERKAVHLGVGRLLMAERAGSLAGEELFGVVHHLDLGCELIEDPDERRQVVLLNLRAAKEAKESAAFQAALGYVQAGLGLLEDRPWHSSYELTLELSMIEAECLYLCGEFEEAERRLELLLREARSTHEKAEVFLLRMAISESLARHADAVRAGQDALQLFGVRFPEEEELQRVDLERELQRIEELLAGRPIASLEELPTLTDDEARMTIEVLTAIWSPAYISGHYALAFLFSARMVRLSLEKGNTEDSAYGYVTHAIAVGPVGGDYASAYEWGRLALRVNELFQDRKQRAKIHQQFNAHVTLWCRPLETCVYHAREACKAGLESGDLNYAGYGAFTETWAALVASTDLAPFVSDYEPTVKLLERIRLRSLADAQTLFLNWARALRGQTEGRLSLSHAGFDEERYVRTHADNRFFLTFHHLAKLHLCVIFEEYDQALEEARRVREEGWIPDGTLWPVLLEFWSGVALARTCGQERGAQARATLEGSVRSLQRLARSCPENFGCYCSILEGESYRLEGDFGSAVRAYEEAIRGARELGNVQMEALACELCAGLWSERQRPSIAAVYWREARGAYSRWGALAKVRDLRARHAEAFDEPGRLRAASEAAPSLDLATALKAARAVAAEIELDRLLEALVRISIEGTGAERGFLLLDRGQGLSVVARGSASSDEVVLCDEPFEARADLSHAIVRFVHRTGDPLILDDATRGAGWVDDDYARRVGPRSILCAPIVHQGRCAGLLYFDNSVVANAFSPRRIELIEVLAAQAAVALDNARLYEETRQEVGRRRRAEETLQQTLEELRELKDRLQDENVYLQEEIRARHNFEEIVGSSEPLLGALRRVEQVSRTGSSVLLLGETGVGKELFARAIHSRSRCSERALVRVNCGAIPAGLVESELFGHVKGAFTGALQDRVGRFELADGGALFLDEVGELPLDVQTMLLRVLQEGEFEPVGSSKTRSVDVRVIAATNRDLDQAVAEGRFRADLLYRLNVFPIRIPPLRERIADIPLLVSFVLTRLSRKLGKSLEGFSRGAMKRLMDYDWPGNVRELENVVERAAIVSRGPILELDDPLGPRRRSDGPRGGSTLAELEREAILAALRSCRGVVEGPGGAARVLGLHPNTLRSRLRKLGIVREHYEIS